MLNKNHNIHIVCNITFCERDFGFYSNVVDDYYEKETLIIKYD